MLAEALRKEGGSEPLLQVRVPRGAIPLRKGQREQKQGEIPSVMAVLTHQGAQAPACVLCRDTSSACNDRETSLLKQGLSSTHLNSKCEDVVIVTGTVRARTRGIQSNQDIDLTPSN